MLFDLGMSELLLIGVVALVVIGPKDLPKALRVAGFWVKKARTLSREFQSSVEQMIREAELDEMRQELKKATEIDLDKEFRNTIDPTGSLAESLKPPELPKFSDADLPALKFLRSLRSKRRSPKRPNRQPHRRRPIRRSAAGRAGAAGHDRGPGASGGRGQPSGPCRSRSPASAGMTNGTPAGSA